MTRRLFGMLLGVCLGTTPWCWAADEKVVARWLEKSSSISTLSTAFTQTRNLTGLSVPLRQRGRLWIDHKHARLRWQVGDPAKTLVIRNAKGLLVVRPGAKQYERKTEKGLSGGVLIATLARGLPSSMAEFHRRYQLQKVAQADKGYRISTRPMGGDAEVIRSLVFVLSGELRLESVEAVLRDRSRQSIRFTNSEINKPIPPSLFEFDLTGFQETKF